MLREKDIERHLKGKARNLRSGTSSRKPVKKKTERREEGNPQEPEVRPGDARIPSSTARSSS